MEEGRVIGFTTDMITENIAPEAVSPVSDAETEAVKTMPVPDMEASESGKKKK